MGGTPGKGYRGHTFQKPRTNWEIYQILTKAAQAENVNCRSGYTHYFSYSKRGETHRIDFFVSFYEHSPSDCITFSVLGSQEPKPEKDMHFDSIMSLELHEILGVKAESLLKAIRNADKELAEKE